ncbi:MAG: glutamyl-tRNA reductase [Cryomorphaceae bacterium]|nr:glutamyl-tRNA reductase [Cryomorphaceae bacterium]
MPENFHSIAFTHRNLEVSTIGKLHIDPEMQSSRINPIKEYLGVDEVLFLSTCNRIEFWLVSSENCGVSFLKELLDLVYPELHVSEKELLLQGAEFAHGNDAVNHVLRVASSIDSMVIGEREIITQVRTAYELCRNSGLTGDLIRLVLRHTIETAKKVYTQTSIATKPVSVVSLAYHRLRDMNVPLDSRILIIGAGTTNTNMSKFLKKHGFKRFAVFNRTFSKAEKLASELNGVAFPLEELATYDGGFDVIISCTGADTHVITPEIYAHLLGEDRNRKVVLDIAIPQDLHPEILENHSVTHISVDLLQRISNENLKERSLEVGRVEELIEVALSDFDLLYRTRQVELAMREVPEKVKEIRSNAVNEIFKKDIEAMDEHSREILEKVLGYMEKKYMSVPMLMAKDILINKN